MLQGLHRLIQPGDNDTHGEDSVRRDQLTRFLHQNQSAQQTAEYLIVIDAGHRGQNVLIPADQKHGLRPQQLMTVIQS